MIDNSKIGLLIMAVLICSSVQLSSQQLYKTNWKQSAVFIGGGAAMFSSAKLIEKKRGTFTEVDLAQLNGENLFQLDKRSAGNFSKTADTHSDFFRDGVWLAPLALFFSGQARENAKEIMTMYAEVFAFNGGLTKLAKAGFGRYRPYAYNTDLDIEFKLKATTRRSFFSGHTSHVASLSFFTATVFDDLYPDSNFRYVVWAGAIAAPAITGYLRVKAGSHFPADVIVGYGVGALVGYLIPKLHKITKETEISIVGAEGGLGMVYGF